MHTNMGGGAPNNEEHEDDDDDDDNYRNMGESAPNDEAYGFKNLDRQCKLMLKLRGLYLKMVKAVTLIFF